MRTVSADFHPAWTAKAWPHRIAACFIGLPLPELRNAATIRKNIAALLMLSFVIASAPKSYFHDLLARHRDTPVCPLKHNGQVVHTRGFDCHFDDLVVTAPFVLVATSFDGNPGIFNIEKQGCEVAFFYPAFEQHSVTRGPPSV